MRFAVLPPEYFPGPEWAAAALSSDVIVLADTFPYVRQSLQNRARLRTPTGTSWLTIPVARGGPGRPLTSIRTDESTPWRRTHRRTLRYHYGSAAFGAHYLPEIEAWVYDSDAGRSGTLLGLTVASCRFLLRSLGATARIVASGALPGSPSRLTDVLSTLEPGAVPVLLPGQAERRAPVAPAALVARWSTAPYRQAFDGFSGGCSALDLLMNHGPRAATLLRERMSLERVAPPTAGSGAQGGPGEIPFGHVGGRSGPHDRIDPGDDVRA